MCAAAAAGDMVVRGFSHESEHDLAALVSDFLENGSSGAESWYSSDSDSGFSDLHHLAERILFWKRTVEQYEIDLLSAVHSFIVSINELELQIANDGQCYASCIRESLVKLLKSSGYDAAVCSSKWLGDGKFPGGDHEYIDVVTNGNNGVSERLIIEIDFQSHFEIARAVESYEAILSSLPVVYVGSLERLDQFLRIMVEATRWSLKQNSMPLPPWRSLPYLQAKWRSPYERKSDANEPDHGNRNSSVDHDQCVEYLRRLKTALWSDIDMEHLYNNSIPSDKKCDKKRRMKFERRQRPSLLRI
ncbi:uncharacterized protein A4U43_C08F35220 [Asparagus officinalis]|uniref:uncharacterized protein LOC109820080 n=1 Tax=Asparagus officinalis TaxID=4686 RepID=UPI00098DF393|nr:uncharacterized protein LOC109820080 [Asparagus officinalis]ONK61949.1 uncharacterized protein A4U43_C08F35220 [Asparagus officinalis]